jgi:hypothetical protein
MNSKTQSGFRHVALGFAVLATSFLVSGCSSGFWFLNGSPSLAKTRPAAASALAASTGGALSPGNMPEAVRLGLEPAKPPAHPIAAAPKTNGMATIIFHRRTGLVNDGVIRYVVDRGTAVEWNAVVEQRREFPDNAGNFCMEHNVTFFSSQRLDLTAPDGARQDNGAVIIGGALAGGLKPNVCLLGELRADHVLQWQRPAGSMRLVVINPNGNESVAKPIQVEAGKTYEITLSYGYLAHFAVNVLETNAALAGLEQFPATRPQLGSVLVQASAPAKISGSMAQVPR